MTCAVSKAFFCAFCCCSISRAEGGSPFTYPAVGGEKGRSAQRRGMRPIRNVEKGWRRPRAGGRGKGTGFKGGARGQERRIAERWRAQGGRGRTRKSIKKSRRGVDLEVSREGTELVKRMVKRSEKSHRTRRASSLSGVSWGDRERAACMHVDH